jgi:branched-chain amino acid transport system ATP-binding protein
MSLLEVEGLEVRYGGLVAVHGIDLTLQEGEVTLILGSNGAGKSSTLNALAGALRPSRGTVRFDGRDITRWPSHKVSRNGLVLVPEGRRIIAPLSVEENLLLGGYSVRSKQRRAELLEEMFTMFPILRERRAAAGGLLSGGEQQMLAFGRALMSQPRLILLDEPSMGLAPIIVDQIMESVTQIAARGVSVLMVEQNAAAALPRADAAYVLEQGEVILHGTAAEVERDPLVLRAFLGLEELEPSEVPGA